MPRRVTAGAAKPLRTIVSGVAAGTEGLEIALPVDDSPATGRVEGRVLDGAGAPVAGVSVILRRGEETLASATSFVRGIPLPARGGATLDAGGRFAFPEIPVGRVTVAVSAAGFRTREVAGVEVRDGGTTTVPPIELDRGVVVTGKLRGPAGMAWKERRLWLHPIGGKADAPNANVVVAGDGTFRATGLVAGTYRVTSPAERMGEKGDPPMIPANGETVVVPEGAAEVRFDADFVPAGTLTIAAMDSRLPWPPWNPGVTTEAQAKFGAASRVLVTGPDGATVLDVTGVFHGGLLGNVGWLTLLPGRYVARLEMPGGETREEIVTLEAGATVSVRFSKR